MRRTEVFFLYFSCTYFLDDFESIAKEGETSFLRLFLVSRLKGEG